MHEFELTHASIPGSKHYSRHRNNQDGIHIIRTPHALILVVTDGCGSAPHSEVGAQLGAKLMGETLHELISRTQSYTPDWMKIRSMMGLKLLRLAATIGEDSKQVINDYLLFTVVAAIILPHRSWFFTFGDGVIAVNGAVTVVKPPLKDAPPYLSLCLDTDAASLQMQPAYSEFQLQVTLETESLRHFLIGTDGVAALHESAWPHDICGQRVGPLSQFWANDLFFHPPIQRYGGGPEELKRRLVTVAHPQPDHDLTDLCPDDMTMIAGRRKRV